MSKKNVNNMTFAEACAAWYAIAEKHYTTGAMDTEPRAEFAQIVSDLAHSDSLTAVVPQRAYLGNDIFERTWQLFSTDRGSYFAGKALTRAAERVVKVAKRVGPEQVQAYAHYQGWFH